jgi:hypothetical protein
MTIYAKLGNYKISAINLKTLMKVFKMKILSILYMGAPTIRKDLGTGENFFFTRVFSSPPNGAANKIAKRRHTVVFLPLSQSLILAILEKLLACPVNFLFRFFSLKVCIKKGSAVFRQKTFFRQTFDQRSAKGECS